MKKSDKKNILRKKRGPEYCDSLLNTKVKNYREYYMNGKEKLLYTIIAFILGAGVSYVMYGGIGSDIDGNPGKITPILNVIICIVGGLFAIRFFMPVREDQLNVKRKNLIRRQFMDFLDSLSTSISSGSNALKAFEISKDDLSKQYGDKAEIVNEVKLILEGQKNFIEIDDMLMDFGKRSGIKEIESFAQVFAISYRKGGNFGKIIRDSYEILYNKIYIEMEIETKVAATKNELNIMLVMPVLLVGIMKMSGGDFAHNLGTASGVFGTTVGLAIILGSYLLGRKITDIEV